MFTEGEDARFGIVAGGISYAYTREALRLLEEEAQAASSCGRKVLLRANSSAAVRRRLLHHGWPRLRQDGGALPAYRIMQVARRIQVPSEARRRLCRGLR